MERIKQALEKARQLRSAAPTASGGSCPNPPTGRGADVQAVHYRHTRVSPLDPAHLERHRIVGHDKSHPATPAFDLLRTQVLQRMEERGWRTLAITSPTAEAGKTLVAINLALSIAHQTNRTAMLVDFDLRRPKVAAYLGLPDATSLNEILEGTAGLPDALVNPDLPRLVVLPIQRPMPRPAETLASARVTGLIADLRERYTSRIVIFDLPPMLHVDDTLAVLPQMDCVLLVVGEGMASKTEIEECRRHLPAASLLGVVLNKAADAPRPYHQP